MKEFWDSRYSNKEYAYGENPNEFFRKEILKLKPGKALFPAEGEGRNAVYAAEHGWDVDAFDYSISGKTKALALAKKRNVTIKYNILSFDNFECKEDTYDCISLIYVHVPMNTRVAIHKELSMLLKPGGIIILEGFSKSQFNKNTGGPKHIDMLFSMKDLLNDFRDLNILSIEEKDIDLNEGAFHKGIASVVRLVAKK